jgi:hypothetical protein
MSDLAVLVTLLYVVNLRLARVPKILFWLSFILIITVYACMLLRSPSNPRSPSIADAARILRHTESGIYSVLVVLVTRATLKLHTAIASRKFTGFPRVSLHASSLRLHNSSHSGTPGPQIWLHVLPAASMDPNFRILHVLHPRRHSCHPQHLLQHSICR